MPTYMKRAIVSLTPELEASAERLKQTKFYNKSYAELYRYLIAEGLKVANPTPTLEVTSKKKERQESG